MSEKKKETVLFVKSAVREYLKSKGFNTSSEILDQGALNSVIKEILDKACSRAEGNKRKTIKARDI
jgi:histone H3/H4